MGIDTVAPDAAAAVRRHDDKCHPLVPFVAISLFISILLVIPVAVTLYARGANELANIRVGTLAESQSALFSETPRTTCLATGEYSVHAGRDAIRAGRSATAPPGDDAIRAGLSVTTPLDGRAVYWGKDIGLIGCVKHEVAQGSDASVPSDGSSVARGSNGFAPDAPAVARGSNGFALDNHGPRGARGVLDRDAEGLPHPPVHGKGDDSGAHYDHFAGDKRCDLDTDHCFGVHEPGCGMACLSRCSYTIDMTKDRAVTDVVLYSPNRVFTLTYFPACLERGLRLSRTRRTTSDATLSDEEEVWTYSMREPLAVKMPKPVAPGVAQATQPFLTGPGIWSSTSSIVLHLDDTGSVWFQEPRKDAHRFTIVGVPPALPARPAVQEEAKPPAPSPTDATKLDGPVTATIENMYQKWHEPRTDNDLHFGSGCDFEPTPNAYDIADGIMFIDVMDKNGTRGVAEVFVQGGKPTILKTVFPSINATDGQPAPAPAPAGQEKKPEPAFGGNTVTLGSSDLSHCAHGDCTATLEARGEHSQCLDGGCTMTLEGRPVAIPMSLGQQIDDPEFAPEKVEQAKPSFVQRQAEALGLDKRIAIGYVPDVDRLKNALESGSKVVGEDDVTWMSGCEEGAVHRLGTFAVPFGVNMPVGGFVLFSEDGNYALRYFDACAFAGLVLYNRTSDERVPWQRIWRLDTRDGGIHFDRADMIKLKLVIGTLEIQMPMSTTALDPDRDWEVRIHLDKGGNVWLSYPKEGWVHTLYEPGSAAHEHCSWSVCRVHAELRGFAHLATGSPTHFIDVWSPNCSYHLHYTEPDRRNVTRCYDGVMRLYFHPDTSQLPKLVWSATLADPITMSVGPHNTYSIHVGHMWGYRARVDATASAFTQMRLDDNGSIWLQDDRDLSRSYLRDMNKAK